MKSKLILIFTILTVAFSAAGCSAEKTLKDKDAGYQMGYDGTVWKVSKNTEVETDFGTYTFNAVFTSLAKTDSGDPAATFMVLREDTENFDSAGELSEDELLDTAAASLASNRMADGIITYQNATIAGVKSYWISVAPMEESDTITDLILCIKDDSVYEFYYTAVGDENYSLYEPDINYMLYNFSEL